ncbi:hypothetical protein GCM10023317_89890 [Actinopolymorpha pittospori]
MQDWTYWLDTFKSPTATTLPPTPSSAFRHTTSMSEDTYGKHAGTARRSGPCSIGASSLSVAGPAPGAVARIDPRPAGLAHVLADRGYGVLELLPTATSPRADDDRGWGGSWQAVAGNCSPWACGCFRRHTIAGMLLRSCRPSYARTRPWIGSWRPCPRRQSAHPFSDAGPTRPQPVRELWEGEKLLPMAKTVYYVSSSIDGFIAGADDSLDWL